MRVQTDLLPPGAEPDLRWVTTPETVRQADAIADRLRAAGLVVERGQDEGEDGDVYEDVALEEEEGIGLSVCEGGGFLMTDAWHDEPQRFWVHLMMLLRAVEDVCGWTSPDADAIEARAAEYGVRPDATVERVAELDERQLGDAVGELMGRYADLPDRPRPAPAGPAVDAVREIAGRLARRGLPPFVVELDGVEGATGMRTPGLTQYDAVQDELDELMAAAEGLYAEVGDEATGHLAMLLVHVEEPVRLEGRYDRITRPDGELLMDWLAVAREVLRRDPQWQPAWVPELRELLHRAGMRA